MSRQKSNGLSYFPLDVDFFEKDKRIRRLIGRFGSDGALFYIYLLCKIYEQGYYAKVDDDFLDDAAVDISCSKEKIGLMLDYLLNKSLLDRKLFDTVKVLTSHGIQIQYQASCKAMKRTAVDVDDRLWVLSDEETKELIRVHSVDDNSEKKADNFGNYCDNSEKKALKESKVNKSKDNSVSNEIVCQTDVQRVLEAWNSLNEFGIQSVSQLSAESKRYKGLKARIAEYGIDEVLNAIERIKQSDFLRGKKTDFIINFDWFVKPNNFPKVHDGNYDNKQCNSSRQQSSFDLDEFDNFTMQSYGPQGDK